MTREHFAVGTGKYLMLIRLWAPRLHKWIALAVGIQLLAWTASGLFMTVVPISTVRGEHNIREQKPGDVRRSDLLDIATVLSKAPPGVLTRVELRALFDKPVYQIDIAATPAVLVDAVSGDVLSPLKESLAKEIAIADFSGSGKVASSRLIAADPSIEYRGALPVWQITFDDPEATSVYVSPVTGRVVARRTTTWRIYDFLWSLHIMDYGERESFNHPLVIVAAGIAFLLTVSGGFLLYQRFIPRLRRWPQPRRSSSDRR